MEETAQAKKAGEETMTVEKRRFIKLEDIKAIHYQCTCGTTISIPRERWGASAQTTCPDCGVTPSHHTRWMSEGEAEAVVRLQNTIKEILGFKTLECEIRLEIEDDKSEREVNS